MSQVVILQIVFLCLSGECGQAQDFVFENFQARFQCFYQHVRYPPAVYR
jgi:hypothetical protein